MALVNETYTIYYVADDFASGLTDVLLTILLPDKTSAGPYTMTEHSERSGVYYYDYTPTQNGQYYTEADSATTPKKVVQVINIESFSNVPYAGFDS